MVKLKIKVKEIRTDDEIDNLTVGNLVNLEGKEALYKGNHPGNDEIYIFIYRHEDPSVINEFHIERDQLFVEEGGFLGFNHYHYRSYDFYKGDKEYTHRDKLLRRVGL